MEDVSLAWMSVDIQKLTHPDQSGRMMHFYEHWWVYVPPRGLVFGSSKGREGSPHCSSSRAVIEDWIHKYSNFYPEGTVSLYLPHVYVPLNRYSGGFWIPFSWRINANRVE